MKRLHKQGRTRDPTTHSYSRARHARSAYTCNHAYPALPPVADGMPRLQAAPLHSSLTALALSDLSPSAPAPKQQNPRAAASTLATRTQTLRCSRSGACAQRLRRAQRAAFGRVCRRNPALCGFEPVRGGFCAQCAPGPKHHPRAHPDQKPLHPTARSRANPLRVSHACLYLSTRPRRVGGPVSGNLQISCLAQR